MIEHYASFSEIQQVKSKSITSVEHRKCHSKSTSLKSLVKNQKSKVYFENDARHFLKFDSVPTQSAKIKIYSMISLSLIIRTHWTKI